MTIDLTAQEEYDLYRKEQIVNCMAGNGTYGWLPDLKKSYCGTIHKESDTSPYDCGLRGSVIFSTTSDGETTIFYECNRSKYSERE